MGNSDTDRIYQMGHRKFVGGEGAMWDEIADLQLAFLKSEGLKPSDYLLDIACGSLRAGRLFINYLDQGRYIGLDKEINLIIQGVSIELSIETFMEKKPTFLVSGSFEFDRIGVRPNYCIAQSLFTHLTAADIYHCLSALHSFVDPGTCLYATIFETNSPVRNLPRSDSIECFFYTKDEMRLLAQISGWDFSYIGNWNHPRGQVMLKMVSI